MRASVRSEAPEARPEVKARPEGAARRGAGARRELAARVAAGRRRDGAARRDAELARAGAADFARAGAAVLFGRRRLGSAAFRLDPAALRPGTAREPAPVRGNRLRFEGALPAPGGPPSARPLVFRPE